jgi:hypothetical protein
MKFKSSAACVNKTAGGNHISGLHTVWFGMRSQAAPITFECGMWWCRYLEACPPPLLYSDYAYYAYSSESSESKHRIPTGHSHRYCGHESARRAAAARSG